MGVDNQNPETVRQFLAAWAHGDVEELLAFFVPGGVYHNIPMEPWIGHDAIRGGIDGFFQIAKNIDFEVRNIAVEDPVGATSSANVCHCPAVTWR